MNTDVTAIGTTRRRKPQGGKCADPAWRRARAAKASAAARRTWWRALTTHAERFPTKAAAYREGYRLGYGRAYRYWKRRADRLERRLRELQAKAAT